MECVGHIPIICVSIPREEKVAKLKAFDNFKHISIVKGYFFAIPRIPSVPNDLRVFVPFCGGVIDDNENEFENEL